MTGFALWNVQWVLSLLALSVQRILSFNKVTSTKIKSRVLWWKLAQQIWFSLEPKQEASWHVNKENILPEVRNTSFCFLLSNRQLVANRCDKVHHYILEQGNGFLYPTTRQDENTQHIHHTWANSMILFFNLDWCILGKTPGPSCSKGG